MPTIIFKPTENCNSNCIYCDVISRKAPRIVSLEFLERVFQKIDEYLRARPEETVTLIWHGGEPCLLGVDYFRKALAFQNAHCSETRSRIEHAVQSDLTTITQEFIDVFRQLGIDQIGTSHEPIPHIRDFGKDRDSEAYHRRFTEGINLLNRNNMGWGFIHAVTRKSLEKPADLFYFLNNFKPGFRVIFQGCEPI